MINQVQLVLFILVLARVSAFIAFFPLFARRQLPSLVKVGLAVSLTLFFYASAEKYAGISGDRLPDLGIVESILLLGKEVFIGVALGITLGIFFLPSKVAGSYVGQELGLSLASISDPASQDSSTLLASIFEAFSILVFFALNLHHFVILVVHNSFERMAGGRANLLQLPTESFVSLFNSVSDYGILMIAPLVILFMLISLCLAFLNKAAPALNLFTIGMSIRSGVGILCMFIFSPVIFYSMQTYLYRIQQDIEQLLMKF